MYAVGKGKGGGGGLVESGGVCGFGDLEILRLWRADDFFFF